MSEPECMLNQCLVATPVWWRGGRSPFVQVTPGRVFSSPTQPRRTRMSSGLLERTLQALQLDEAPMDTIFGELGTPSTMLGFNLTSPPNSSSEMASSPGLLSPTVVVPASPPAVEWEDKGVEEEEAVPPSRKRRRTTRAPRRTTTTTPSDASGSPDTEEDMPPPKRKYDSARYRATRMRRQMLRALGMPIPCDADGGAFYRPRHGKKRRYVRSGRYIGMNGSRPRQFKGATRHLYDRTKSKFLDKKHGTADSVDPVENLSAAPGENQPHDPVALACLSPPSQRLVAMGVSSPPVLYTSEI